MTDLKAFASLSSKLLARKGGARPAMRPNLGHFGDATARNVEHDLGWNDMGHDDDASLAQQAVQHEAEVVSIVPEVVRQQAAIAAKVAARSGTQRARRSALADGRRAAFTLRVDAERHLRLRLACTIKGRSAQQLVIEALDGLIASLPDLDSLAAQVAKRR